MAYDVQPWRKLVLAVCAVTALAGCQGGSEGRAQVAPTGGNPVTELLSDVVVDAAIATVDQLGRSTTSETGDGLLQFISAAGDEDAVRFRAAATLDSRRQIGQAMRDGDPGALEASLERAGRVEGEIVTAEIRHQVAATGGGEELTAAQRRQAAAKLVSELDPGERPNAGFLDGLTTDRPSVGQRNPGQLADDLVSAAANDRPSIERFTVVQAALDAGLIDADDLGRLAHTVRGGRAVLDPGLDAEDLAEVYFDIDFDRGSYERGWESGFGGLEGDSSP